MKESPARRDGSFLVRIWWESGTSSAAPAWRGRVEHIPSQTAAYFERADQLLAFIAEMTGAAAAPEAEGRDSVQGPG